VYRWDTWHTAAMRDPWDPGPTARERAYAHVKERILDGALPGGDLLSEGEVASELGMSRTPVRAAFGQLEAEGFLRLYPRRGAIVTPVSAREAESVLETRWVIERYAVEQSDAALGAALTESLEAQDGLEAEAFVEADRAFHRALVASTDNDILLSLYDSLRDRQRRMARATVRSEARRVTTLTEHRELAAAIAAGDKDAALEVLRRHLDGALEALRGR
jgi:DNA-binding GntR family transcriptional regulator